MIAFPASLLRAGVFFLISSINDIYDFNIKPLNILLITVVINIIFEPYIIYQIGFQYSVISVAGLIYMSEYLNQGNYLSKLFKTTLIAQVFSLPITLANYFEINLLSLITNLIFVPLITILVYPLAIIIIFLPVLNSILALIVTLCDSLNNLFAQIKWLTISIPFTSIIWSLIYYGLLILWLKIQHKVFIGLLLFELLIIKYHYNFDNHYYVYYFDVKQGDSSLIITPYQKQVILIDTGGITTFEQESWQIKNKKYQISDNIIRFMKSRNINKIDILITSHGDYDHMGEAINLVNNFQVANVIFNVSDYNKLELELIKILEEKNIPFNQNIESLRIGNDKVNFLNTKDYDNENENSNVLYLNIANKKLLFMGDAGVKREQDIIKYYNIKQIDFLKVGHHGSNTSSSKEFIDTITPKHCIISVGANNRYGHPKNSVLKLLKSCNIYRTDLSGSIELKLINSNFEVKIYSP